MMVAVGLLVEMNVDRYSCLGERVRDGGKIGDGRIARCVVVGDGIASCVVVGDGILEESCVTSNC